MIFIFLIGQNHGFSKIITDDPKFAWSNPMSSGLWVLSMIIFTDFSWSALLYIYIYIPPMQNPPIFLINSSEIISFPCFPMIFPCFPMVFPLGPSPSAKACGLDGAPPSHSESQQLTRRAAGVHGGSPEPGASWPVRLWLVGEG